MKILIWKFIIDFFRVGSAGKNKFIFIWNIFQAKQYSLPFLILSSFNMAPL